MPFASEGASRKAQQRAGILKEAIPLCWNAAAAPLWAQTQRAKAAISAERRCRRGARPSRHWLLDSAWLCTFAADSDTLFISTTYPKPETKRLYDHAAIVKLGRVFDD